MQTRRKGRLLPASLSSSLSVPSLSASFSLPSSQLHARGTSLARACNSRSRYRGVEVYVSRSALCMYLRCIDTRYKRVAAAVACSSRVCVRAVRSVFAIFYFYVHTRLHTCARAQRCVRAVRATGIRKTHATSFKTTASTTD